MGGDLGCPHCGVHFLLREAWANSGLCSLSPPWVPDDVLLDQPQPGVALIYLRHRRRLVHLLLPGHPGLVVSTVLRGVAAPGVRLPPLPLGLPGRPVRWVIGGCTGSSRFHGRRYGICARSSEAG